MYRLKLEYLWRNETRKTRIVLHRRRNLSSSFLRVRVVWYANIWNPEGGECIRCQLGRNSLPAVKPRYQKGGLESLVRGSVSPSTLMSNELHLGSVHGTSKAE